MVDHKTFQKRMSPERLSQLERAFGRWGSLVVFFGRLLPGLRAQIFLVAGTLRMNRALFFVTDAISASVNMCLWGGIGYVGATNITTLRTHLSRIEIFVFLALLATIGGGLFLKYCRKSRKSV